jgi:hypothetical protein
MAALELPDEGLVEAVDISACIEVSDICFEMLIAEKNQDRKRMAAAMARLERLEATNQITDVETIEGRHV